ncbi:MAG: PIN domain-containing protein [Gammaproteobacteria bacterium]|nr:PIN domain-containing protein [Gammaproteobacteria bacterium]
MKILFDTNIILDVLLDREPFSEPAAKLFSLVEMGRMNGYVSASSITTIHYLATKVIGTKKAHQAIEKILELLEVSPINRTVLATALSTKMTDYEDAVIYQAAAHAGCQAIVSRNRKDFKSTKIPVYSSLELIKIIELTPIKNVNN